MISVSQNETQSSLLSLALTQLLINWFSYCHCLTVLSLSITIPELPNLNDRDTVKALRDRVMDAIRYNLKVRQQEVDKVVNRIQIGVQKLRKMGVEHRKVLESLRSDEAFEFPDDLYAELFELISD